MKKLVAMLLCIALVAALGVQAFAAEPTDQDMADHYNTLADVAKREQAKENTKAAMLEEVEHVYHERALAQAALDPADANYATKLAKIEADAQAALDAIYKSNETLAKVIWDPDAAAGEVAVDPWTLDQVTPYDAVMTQWDGDIATYKANAAAYTPVITSALSNAAVYEQLVADAAEAARVQKILDERAAAKAKKQAALNRAAQKAWEAYSKELESDMKPADIMLRDAKVDAVYQASKTADAKAAVKSAQDYIETAKNAAVAQAQNIALYAQQKAFDKLAYEINTAVNDYVADVWTEIGNAYADINWEFAY